MVSASAFTFSPDAEPGVFGTIFRPRFVADPGTLVELTVDETLLSQRADGTFGLYLTQLPYNPSQYQLTRTDGTVYHYDQFNGLQSIVDRNGNQLVFTSDGITHSSGESIDFVQDSQGRIAQVIDPADNRIIYSYDAAGNLAAVTDQAGLTTQFTYLSDPSHYLEEVIDPLGRMVQRTEYDDDGRIVAVTDALGNRLVQLWDPANFTGAITDGNGNVTELIYDQRGNVLQETDPLGGVLRYSYDDPNNPDLETAITDTTGNTTKTTYDHHGNLLTIANRLGGVASFK